MNNNDIEILNQDTLDAIEELKKEGYTNDEIKESLTSKEENAFQTNIEEEMKKAAEEIIAQNTINPSINTEDLIKQVTGINNNQDLPTEKNSAFHSMTDSAFARNNPLDNDTKEAIEELRAEGFTPEEITNALTDIEKASYKGERENQEKDHIINTSIVDKKEDDIKERIENLTGVQRTKYDRVTPENSAFNSVNMSDFDFNDFLQTNEEKLRIDKEKEKAVELIEKRKQEEQKRRDELNSFTKEELINKIMNGEFDRVVTPQESFKIRYEQDDPVEYMENRIKHDWENKSAFATMSDKEFEKRFGKVDSDIKEVKPNYKFDNFEDLSKTIYNAIDKEAEIDNKFKFDRTKLKIKNENLLRKIFIGGYDLAKNAFTQVYEKTLEKTWTKKEDILKDENKFLMPNEDTQNMKFGNFINIDDLKESLKDFYQNNKFKTYKVKNESGKVVKYRLAKKQLTDFIDKLGDCYTIVKNNELEKGPYVSVEDVIKNMPSMFRKKNIWVEKLVNQIKTKMKKENIEEKENNPIDPVKQETSTSIDNAPNNLPEQANENDTVIIENGKRYVITEDGEKKELPPQKETEKKNPAIEEGYKYMVDLDTWNKKEDQKNDPLVDFKSLTSKEIEPIDREKDKLPLMDWDQVMANYATTSQQEEPTMDLDSLMEQANRFVSEFNNTENNNLNESVGGRKR